MTVSLKILKLSDVIKKTGLSRSTIYALLKRNEFPVKLQLSVRSVGFLESEVDNWIECKAKARGAKGV